MQTTASIQDFLVRLYGEKSGEDAYTRLQLLLTSYKKHLTESTPPPLDQHDSFLITYGDQFQAEGEAPLQTLAEFCRDFLKESISGIHILPFFPYTSDDGFSVSDYRRVNPALGSWEDIEAISKEFRLMVDAVINHCSASHPWFQGFLHADPAFQDYFISVPPEIDLSMVVRPRALPLLTSFPTSTGIHNVWTTFSSDQVDLNYSHPGVLLEIIEVLLEYAAHGAQMIRMDAIAYLWKEFGTICIHLPQTHWIIQLFRAVFEEVAPYVNLITETNVPHQDNVSYFGDGYNEAHFVYNFALPPLVLHSIQQGDTRALTAWASGLTLPSDKVGFFNFLASHDGIGLNPARGILTDTEIENIIERTLQLGGQVSYKNNPDGTQSAYELNINYFDALGDPQGNISQHEHIQRFMAAQAILLAFQGIPGIYVHSLLGSRGWPEGVTLTGQKRTINRQKFQDAQIRAHLSAPASLQSQIFRAYAALLKTRAGHTAFHPAGGQQTLDLGSQTFVLLRTSPDHSEIVLCLHNLSARPATIHLPAQGIMDGKVDLHDLLQPDKPPVPSHGLLELKPWQVSWLTVEKHSKR